MLRFWRRVHGIVESPTSESLWRECVCGRDCIICVESLSFAWARIAGHRGGHDVAHDPSRALRVHLDVICINITRWGNTTVVGSYSLQFVLDLERCKTFLEGSCGRILLSNNFSVFILWNCTAFRSLQFEDLFGQGENCGGRGDG